MRKNNLKIKDIVKFELYNEEKQVKLQDLKTEPILIKGNNKIEKYKYPHNNPIFFI